MRLFPAPWHICGLLLALLCLSVPLRAQIHQVSQREAEREARLLEAEKWRLLGDWDKAEKGYKALLDEAPATDAAHFGLARVYDTLGRDELALKHLARAVELDPDNEWYRLTQARVLEKNRRYEEAAAVFAALRKKNPHVVDWYLREAALHVQAGRLDEAVEVYEALERVIGLNEALARRKHALYLAMNQQKKAERVLVELVRAFPDKPKYRYLLAQYYERQGQSQKARKVWQEVLARWPDDPQARLALAQDAADGNGDYRYLLSLEEAFARPDVHIDAKLPKILPYIQQLARSGDTTLAVPLRRLTEVLTRVHPSEAKAWAAAADVHYCLGEVDKAIAQYRRALEADDDAWSVWEQLLMVLAREGRFDELRDLSEEGLELFPNQPVMWYFNALAWLETGSPDDALASLDNASFMPMPEPLEARMEVLRGRALMARGQLDEAGRILQQATERWPQLPEAWEALGDWHAARGETDQARSLWQKAATLGGASATLKKKLAQQ